MLFKSKMFYCSTNSTSLNEISDSKQVTSLVLKSINTFENVPQRKNQYQLKQFCLSAYKISRNNINILLENQSQWLNHKIPMKKSVIKISLIIPLACPATRQAVMLLHSIHSFVAFINICSFTTSLYLCVLALLPSCICSNISDF